jgi:hypothetical protein
VNPKTEKWLVDDVLDDNIAHEDLDYLSAGDRDEINALLHDANSAKDGGDSAPLEPLPVLLAEERARFNGSRG